MLILTQSETIILVLAAFFTSMLSAILGMGGGVALLAIMMQYFPPAFLIPMHGTVQLVSNGFRTALNFKHIEWKIFIPLLIGGLFGAFSSYFLVLDIPTEIYAVVLPILILYFTWKPKRKKQIRLKAKFYVLGFFSNLMSLLFGVTGPLLAPFFLNENLNRFQIIATKAATQFVGHVTKIIIYTIIGVQLAAHIKILVLMVIAVLAGTFIGTKLLGKLSDKIFIYFFKGLISLLCIRMLIIAVSVYF